MTTIYRICVYPLIMLIALWLSIGMVQSGNYDPRPWHIVQFVWQYHGYDCAVCVDDMTFVRGGGPRAGERCRIILPENMSYESKD